MIFQSFAPDPSSLRPRRSLPRQQELEFPRVHPESRRVSRRVSRGISRRVSRGENELAVDRAQDSQASLQVLGELAGVVLIFLVFLTLAAIL
jgi:hypothetical protein